MLRKLDNCYQMILDATLLGSHTSTETETDCTRWAMIRSQLHYSCVSLCVWWAVRTGRPSKLISAGTRGLRRGRCAEPSFPLVLLSLERRNPAIRAYSITTLSHIKTGTFIFIFIFFGLFSKCWFAWYLILTRLMVSGCGYSHV